MNENEIWLQILNDLEFKNVEPQNMNFLDLCTGWGRLIFQVALKSKLQFHSYDGIDINMSCKKRFERLAKVYRSFNRRNFEVQFHERSLLDYMYGKGYALITASWALGFFNEG